MNHLSEEQIVLHYYSDAENSGEIQRHLASCSECRAQFEQVQALLQQIEPGEVPEPAAGFEEKTWLNLRDRMPEKRKGFLPQLFASQKWALAGVMALLLLAAFLTGRWWPRSPDSNVVNNSGGVNPQRVVLVTVGDHLERSQMLLVEVMNADTKGPIDLSAEQAQARDLLDANYLYRVSAQRAGDPQVARVLDDLGRVLTEIANGPTDLTAADLKEIRKRIQSEGLLFKIRVVGSQVDSKVHGQERTGAGNVNQRL
jgi:hypothetical protein